MRVDIALEIVDRTGIQIQFAIGEGQIQPDGGFLTSVYSLRTEKQEMNAQGKSGETDQKMFTPAFESDDSLIQ